MRYPAKLQQFFILIFCLCNLLFINTAMAKEDEFKIKSDSLELPRTSSSTRNSSSNDDIEIIPLGTPEFPGLCKYRGHVGKYQCKKVSAKKESRYSCKGKGVYYSKVDGKKYCYTCPDGFKRTSPTRKMNHSKACVNRTGKNTYKPAASRVDNVDGCASGQFKHKGFCKSCPAQTKRGWINKATGIDNGKCTVKKEYRCNAGLSLHKSAPKNIWDRGGNWIGLKHKKYCGLPFSLADYGEEIVNSEANKLILQGLVNLGAGLADATGATKTKVEKIEKALKDNDPQKAYELIAEFPEFEALIQGINNSSDAFEESGEERKKFAITVGFVTDGSIILGGNYEIGLGYDVSSGTFKIYHSYGLTKGVSVSVDGAINVGIWKGEFADSYTQGYTLGLPVLPIGYSGSLDIGLGVWSDYYTPKRADGLNQPHFVGVNALVGIGAGFEFGEYAEVWTDVKD